MNDEHKQDAAEPTPASAGSVWDDCDKYVLFSERVYIAGLAVKWCEEREAPAIPVNLVTALVSMRMLFGSRPTLTDAEREAVSDCLKFAFPATHPTAATLRGLLERTK